MNKGRDVAAERLKEGECDRSEIPWLDRARNRRHQVEVRRISKKGFCQLALAFSRKESSYCMKYFKRQVPESECGGATAQAAATDSAEAVSLAQGIRMLDLTDLDKSATRTLANAKKRFEDARRKATEAFANDTLELSDRVLAMQYRVMATILETVDNPEDALSACRVCIEELYCLSAVKECFTVEPKKGLWARF